MNNNVKRKIYIDFDEEDVKILEWSWNAYWLFSMYDAHWINKKKTLVIQDKYNLNDKRSFENFYAKQMNKVFGIAKINKNNEFSYEALKYKISYSIENMNNNNVKRGGATTKDVDPSPSRGTSSLTVPLLFPVKRKIYIDIDEEDVKILEWSWNAYWLFSMYDAHWINKKKTLVIQDKYNLNDKRSFENFYAKQMNKVFGIAKINKNNEFSYEALKYKISYQIE